jgi:LAO/AO transport system kinase
MDIDWNALIDDMKSGSCQALARLITCVENREHGWEDAMQRIFTDTGRARTVGITGFPGSGKSTITGQMIRELVNRGKKVGVITVDPTSPFTGGALLGDRIRMNDVSNSDGVFIRSMGSRGGIGGLNQAARDIIKILDAYGKDYVLVETVGVGQNEVEIVKTVELTVLICAPGHGDAIQALKCGVMEIADIFVVNKSDCEGAHQLETNIQAMLALGDQRGIETPPVLKTQALKGQGVDRLVAEIDRQLNSVERKTAKHQELIRDELLWLLERKIVDMIRVKWFKGEKLEEAIKMVASFEKDPYSVINDYVSRNIAEIIKTRSDADLTTRIDK